LSKKKSPTHNDLSVPERIARAAAKTQRLVEHTIDLITLHEGNRIIVYSPALAPQVTGTRAATAFNYFQDAMMKYEIVRLCALFNPCDPTDFDVESIPAVVAMIDHPDVLTALMENTRREWLGSPGTRVYEQPNESAETKALIAEAIKASETEWADRQAAKAYRRLQNAVKWTKHLNTAPRVKSVRNLRDKHLAHSLERTRREKNGVIAPMKHGDQRRLLHKAIALVDALHHGVNRTGFDWSESVQIARRNAQALWGNCTFQIPDRRSHSHTAS